MGAFYIFVVCVACGVVSGVAYDVLYILRHIFCARPFPRAMAWRTSVAAVCDILYALSLSALFIFCSVYFSFPDIRLYMLLACLLGAVMYIKSLHIIVAFFVNKLYNRGVDAE